MFALLAMSGNIGGAVMPFVIGALADAGGTMRSGFAALLLPAAGFIAVAQLLGRILNDPPSQAEVCPEWGDRSSIDMSGQLQSTIADPHEEFSQREPEATQLESS